MNNSVTKYFKTIWSDLTRNLIKREPDQVLNSKSCSLDTLIHLTSKLSDPDPRLDLGTPSEEEEE